MYQSEFRKFKTINLFTIKERALIEKFIKFDEECFHRIDLKDQSIYWASKWRLKVNYFHFTKNLLELICNLYDNFNNHKEILVKKGLKKPHLFLYFFFDWEFINVFYDKRCIEQFRYFQDELKFIYDNKPEKFLQFIKKINKINKKNFLKNTEDFKKINYKIKKI